MEKSIITFSTNEQNLIKTGGIGCYASDTVSYIEAQFTLGENWSGYDSVRAVWFNDYQTISTVLDPDGICIVPHEVLVNRGKVMVNLVGSILVSDELSDRLTTFPCEALKVSAKAKISGSETAAVTPSQFEQFVSIVIAEVEKVTGMTAQAETLPAGSQATARYEDGILYLGIPQGIQGERGETGADGNGIASVVYNADYSLTLIFDNGERFTTPPIRGERGPAGPQGPQGPQGESIVGPQGPKGDTGASAGFGTVSASVDDSTGTPSVEVTASGTDTAKNFAFAFHNLKGAKGDKGDDGTVPDLDLILPTDTVSGDIVSITDGQSVVPVKSLKVTLEPIQSGSGTPSPDNVRPISGHTECVTEVCGKNMLPALTEETKTHHGITGVSDGNGKITFSGTASEGAYNQTFTLDKQYTIKSGDYLHIMNSVASGSAVIILQKAGGTQIAGPTMAPVNRIFDLSPYAGQTIETIRFYVASGVTFNATITPMICNISAATDFEPYIAPTTYTTTLGRTVYGGTLDVVTGELVVDRAYKEFDGSDDEQWMPYGTGQRFYINIPDYTSPTSTVVDDKLICNALQTIRKSEQGVAVGVISGADTGYHSIIVNVGTSSVEDLRAWLADNPLQVCYPLATPQTYQLDPQTIMLLHGNNNVWSDGSVVMAYNADVQLWVLKQLGTSGTRTLSMTTLTKSEETKTELTKTDDTETELKSVQLAED